MFDDEKQNGFFAEDNDLDLGSDMSGDFADFTPLDDENIGDIFGDTPKTESIDQTPVQSQPTTESNPAAEPVSAQPADTPEEKTKETEETEDAGKDNVPEAIPPAKAEVKANSGDGAAEPNIFEAAMAAAEEKQANATKSSLKDKLPIFSYAKAEEEIVDTSKTFDQLRNEKAEDFPELDESEDVSWKMVYGSITKYVSTPKKTTIASLKKQIEDSKEFLNALKKAKGEIRCEVIPSVTAKKKGIVSSYKGIYTSLDDAARSGKTITFVPSDNGKVYEVRFNRIGVFSAEADTVSIANKVRAGFTPALPKIPYHILSQIIAFSKSLVTEESRLEAMANVYWSFSDAKYYVHVPKQEVSAISVDTKVPEMDEEKFLLVMEIHSHNTMEAIFSLTDNRDERATRLYAVIGRLNKVFPDIAVRISVGGKFVEIPAHAVFEGISGEFPENWSTAVEPKWPSKKETVQ